MDGDRGARRLPSWASSASLAIVLLSLLLLLEEPPPLQMTKPACVAEAAASLAKSVGGEGVAARRDRGARARLPPAPPSRTEVASVTGAAVGAAAAVDSAAACGSRCPCVTKLAMLLPLQLA